MHQDGDAIYPTSLPTGPTMISLHHLSDPSLLNNAASVAAAASAAALTSLTDAPIVNTAEISTISSSDPQSHVSDGLSRTLNAAGNALMSTLALSANCPPGLSVVPAFSFQRSTPNNTAATAIFPPLARAAAPQACASPQNALYRALTSGFSSSDGPTLQIASPMHSYNPSSGLATLLGVATPARRPRASAETGMSAARDLPASKLFAAAPLAMSPQPPPLTTICAPDPPFLAARRMPDGMSDPGVETISWCSFCHTSPLGSCPLHTAIKRLESHASLFPLPGAPLPANLSMREAYLACLAAPVTSLLNPLDRLMARACAGGFVAVDLGAGGELHSGRDGAAWCARVVLADSLFGGGMQHAERVNADVIDVAQRIPPHAWPSNAERLAWISAHSDADGRAAPADEVWWACAAAAYGLTILVLHDLSAGLPLVVGSGPTWVIIGWQVANRHFVRVLPRGIDLSALHFAAATDRVQRLRRHATAKADDGRPRSSSARSANSAFSARDADSVARTPNHRSTRADSSRTLQIDGRGRGRGRNRQAASREASGSAQDFGAQLAALLNEHRFERRPRR